MSPQGARPILRVGLVAEQVRGGRVPLRAAKGFGLFEEIFLPKPLAAE